mgnify:CR=1 FL=1
MSAESPILETHMFFSSRKDKDIFKNTLERAFAFPVENIAVEFEDRPDEFYKTVNDRTKKILLSIPKPEKITKIEGVFSDGGSFILQNNALTVIVREDEYNYELLDSMKNVLGPVFPLWMFKTPYIWGATIFDDYERQHFFDSRKYSVRSQKLEEPELDIYRRDNGIIYKVRFFTNEDFEAPEEGLRTLAPTFQALREGLQKRSYEGLEVLYTYCADKATFRHLEPKTKLAKDVKAILSKE